MQQKKGQNTSFLSRMREAIQRNDKLTGSKKENQIGREILEMK